MHGWLAKWRGTLLGNEELRSKVNTFCPISAQWLTLILQGMREMREARAVRKRRAERDGKSHHASTGRSIFSIFSFYMGSSKKPVRKPANPRHHSSRSTHRTRQSHRSTQTVRPSPKSPGTSRRSKSSGHRGPSSRSYPSGSARNHRGRSTR